jgi:hypothetical protein
MLGIKVPLYYAPKQRAGVREALASRAAALQELQAMRHELLFRLTDNFVQAQRAEQLLAIHRSEAHTCLLPWASALFCCSVYSRESLRCWRSTRQRDMARAARRQRARRQKTQKPMSWR